MKLFLISLGFVAICSGTPFEVEDSSYFSGDCTGNCPKIFDPVCGADGKGNYKYFHNDCLMNYASCVQPGTVWHVTKMLYCLENVEERVQTECLRPCTFIYEPVCATNGLVHELFANACVLKIENCLVHKKWSEVEMANCEI